MVDKIKARLNVPQLLGRAVATALEVAISVLTAKGLLDWSVGAGELALATGAGAGLSVIGNGLHQWLAATEDQ